VAASLAKGRSILYNAAREPEVVDLAELLNKMGARVLGAGTSTIQIQGVEGLGAAEHTIIPDRVETGTFIAAAALTGGELEIKDCLPEHLSTVISKLREVGVEINELNPSSLEVRCREGLKRVSYNRALSRLSHGHAGAIHGPDDPGGWPMRN